MVVAAVLWGCPRETKPPALKTRPPPEVLALHGYRALVGTLAPYLPVFDVERAPKIQIDADRVSDLSVVLTSTSARAPIVLPYRVQAPLAADEPALVVTTSSIAKPPPGSYALELRERDVVLKRWPVLFDVTPEERAEVRAVQALIDTGELDAAYARAAASADPFVCMLTSRIDRTRGQPIAAAESLLRCADVATRAAVPSERSRCLRAAAYYLQRARQYDQALAVLDLAEAHDREIGDAAGVVAALYHRGVVGHWIGDFRLAKLSFESAIQESVAIGKNDVFGGAASALASTLFALGLPEDAERWARRALDAAHDLDPLNRGVVEQALAWILLHGRCIDDDCLSEALGLLQNARRRLLSKNDRSSVAAVDLDIAIALLRRGQIADAERRLADVDVSALDRQRTDHDLLVIEIALARGDHSQAIATSRRAVAQTTDRLEADAAWRAHAALGRALRAGGHIKEAALALRTAIGLLESAERRTPLMFGRASYIAERRTLFLEAIETWLLRGKIPEAFEIATQASARVLRALEWSLRVSYLGPEPRARFLAALETYQAARDRWEQRVGERRLLVGADLRRFDASQKRTQKELEAQIEALSEMLDDGAARPVPTAADVQAALQPDEVLIEVLSTPGGPLAFIVSSDRIEVIRSAEQVAAIIEAHQEVHHLFVADASGVLALDTLTVRGAPLRTVVDVSTITNTGLLLQRDRPTGHGVLVIADPVGDLPAARAEGTAVASTFDGAETLFGASATRGHVRRSLGAGRQIVHFAGHGVLSTEDPWNAHLVLAPPDRLTLEDVLVLRAPVGLVVLSGCETGASLKLARGESVGLADAFLAAGARTVVAIDVRVEDQAALGLMKALYAEGLASHPARALRRVAAKEPTGDATWRHVRVLGLRSTEPPSPRTVR